MVQGTWTQVRELGAAKSSPRELLADIRLGGKRGKAKLYLLSFKIKKSLLYTLDFPGGSDRKEFTCNARDLGSVPGLG